MHGRGNEEIGAWTISCDLISCVLSNYFNFYVNKCPVYMHVPRFPRNYWILFLGGKLLGIFLKFKTNSGENIFNVQQIMGLSLFNFYPFTAPTLSCKKFKWPILPELRCIVLIYHLSTPLHCRAYNCDWFYHSGDTNVYFLFPPLTVALRSTIPLFF